MLYCKQVRVVWMSSLQFVIKTSTNRTCIVTTFVNLHDDTRFRRRTTALHLIVERACSTHTYKVDVWLQEPSCKKDRLPLWRLGLIWTASILWMVLSVAGCYLSVSPPVIHHGMNIMNGSPCSFLLIVIPCVTVQLVWDAPVGLIAAALCLTKQELLWLIQYYEKWMAAHPSKFDEFWVAPSPLQHVHLNAWIWLIVSFSNWRFPLTKKISRVYEHRSFFFSSAQIKYDSLISCPKLLMT